MTKDEQTKLVLIGGALIIAILIAYASSIGKAGKDMQEPQNTGVVGGIPGVVIPPTVNVPPLDFNRSNNLSPNKSCCSDCKPKPSLALSLPSISINVPPITQAVFDAMPELSQIISRPLEVNYNSPDDLEMPTFKPPPRARLFKEPGFKSKEVTSSVAVPNMSSWSNKMNDGTRSVIIESGNWELCEHANYGGYCSILGPGEYPDLRANEPGLYKKVSSFRPVENF